MNEEEKKEAREKVALVKENVTKWGALARSDKVRQGVVYDIIAYFEHLLEEKDEQFQGVLEEALKLKDERIAQLSGQLGAAKRDLNKAKGKSDATD